MKLIKHIPALLLFVCGGCSQFLDEKSDKKLVTLSSLESLQAVLDNPRVVMSGYCYAGEQSADDYYLSDASYANLADEMQRRYRWEPSELFQSSINDWQNAYQAIYAVNSVLQTLGSIEKTDTNADTYDHIKGQALALRGLRLLDLASVFCLAYDEQTADTDLGLPLRLDPDFNKPSKRSSLADTYRQILSDLETSADLLPEQSFDAYRASKLLAYALLARTYLYMRQYAQAEAYADSYLQLRSNLLDFNTLNPEDRYPIPQLNNEVIFRGTYYHTTFSRTNLRIDESRYQEYKDNDLRKSCFFTVNANDGSLEFRGTFTASAGLTVAPTTSEIWLIKAECRARENDSEGALRCINRLLAHRMEKASFVPYDQPPGGNLLDFVLNERRKELLMRGVRWMDVKRLNKEGRNIGLTRQINGETYVLPANDLRFALALPEEVVQLSRMEQNPR